MYVTVDAYLCVIEMILCFHSQNEIIARITNRQGCLSNVSSLSAHFVSVNVKLLSVAWLFLLMFHSFQRKPYLYMLLFSLKDDDSSCFKT